MDDLQKRLDDQKRLYIKSEILFFLYEEMSTFKTNWVYVMVPLCSILLFFLISFVVVVNESFGDILSKIFWIIGAGAGLFISMTLIWIAWDVFYVGERMILGMIEEASKRGIDVWGVRSRMVDLDKKSELTSGLPRLKTFQGDEQDRTYVTYHYGRILWDDVHFSVREASECFKSIDRQDITKYKNWRYEASFCRGPVAERGLLKNYGRNWDDPRYDKRWFVSRK